MAFLNVCYGSVLAGIGAAAGAVVDKVKGNKELEQMEKDTKAKRDEWDDKPKATAATHHQTDVS